jgi:hypothetical protein
MPYEYENQGGQDGRQKGTYRGLRAGIHCHFVGGNDHIQIGNERYAIRWAHSADRQDKAKQEEITNLRRAWAALKAKGDASPGCADCKLWLKSYLIDYHEINATKVT